MQQIEKVGVQKTWAVPTLGRCDERGGPKVWRTRRFVWRTSQPKRNLWRTSCFMWRTGPSFSIFFSSSVTQNRTKWKPTAISMLIANKINSIKLNVTLWSQISLQLMLDQMNITFANLSKYTKSTFAIYCHVT